MPLQSPNQQSYRLLCFTNCHIYFTHYTALKLRLIADIKQLLLRYTNLYTINILLAFYINLLHYFIVSECIQPSAAIRNKPLIN